MKTRLKSFLIGKWQCKSITWASVKISILKEAGPVYLSEYMLNFGPLAFLNDTFLTIKVWFENNYLLCLNWVQCITNTQLSFHYLEVFTAIKWFIVPKTFTDGVLAFTSNHFCKLREISLDAVFGRIISTAFVDSMVWLATEIGDFTENFFQREVVVNTPKSVKGEMYFLSLVATWNNTASHSINILNLLVVLFQ